MMPYHHTQPGIVIMAVCLVIGAVSAAILWRTGQAALIPMLVILAAVGAVFHSLNVEIEGRELRWYFGPGFWTYRLALDDIRTVSVVRSQWWNGFGIRKARGFSLYNVSGLDAVEIRLKSGEICRIGTDDPNGLASALQSALRGN